MRDAEKRASELRGNWRKFEAFGWHDEPADGEEWCIVYTKNRDSKLAELSNAKVIDAAMAKYDETVVQPQHSGHWAVGWIDGFAIRCFHPDGRVTAPMLEWLGFEDAYPLLDSDSYSEAEYECGFENVRSAVENAERLDLDTSEWPKHHLSDLYDHLYENYSRGVLEPEDYSVTEQEILDAALSLGWHGVEEAEVQS